ncbi:MAG: hypothetical protein V1793_18885 [Pseudomonadota bacterium]
MKHIMIVFAVASVFLLTSFQGWAKDPEGPMASVPGGEYRFDPAPEGTAVTHDYVIRNKGDATLRIDNVKTG